MRINLYLNEEKDKDKIICDMLKDKYDPQSYIKEILYSIAKGNKMIKIEKDYNIAKENEEEFEEIVGVENIEI